MWSPITKRLRHLHGSLLRPLWSWIFVGLAGTLSLLDWLRETFMGEDAKRRFAPMNLLPHWPWSLWLCVFMGALLVVMFEGSFRRTQEVERERDDTSAQVADLKERDIAAREHSNRLQERQIGPLAPIVRALQAREEQAALGLFDQPKPEWLPLHKLPFAIPRQEQFEGMQAVWPLWFYDIHLCDGNTEAPSRDPNMAFDPASPLFQDSAGNELTVCRVVWDEACFQWMWAKKLIPTHRHGLSCAPWELDALGYRASLPPDVVERLTQKAGFVWRVLQMPIQPLLDAGRVKLWGRKGSATAPYSAVAADMWPHYEIVDWEAGRAQAPNGELLFSVRAEFAQAASVEPQRPTPERA